jgi:hypothetical protein
VQKTPLKGIPFNFHEFQIEEVHHIKYQNLLKKNYV